LALEWIDSKKPIFMKPLLLKTILGLAMFTISFVLLSMTPQNGPAADGIMYKVTHHGKTSCMPSHLAETHRRQHQDKEQDCQVAPERCTELGRHSH
jgi:hypothetical protein